MPFDEWYDDATREAATARVLQRRMTNPTDRNVLTVVAEEFNVPRQTLSDWVDEASPETAKPRRKPRPKFSQVVKTTKEARVESPEDDEPTQPLASAAPPEPEDGHEDGHEDEDEEQPQPEPVSESEPAALPQADIAPAPEPDPWAEPTPAAEAEAEPDPDPDPEPEPESTPGNAPEPQPAPASGPAPAAGLAPDPTPAPAAPADDRLTALEAQVAALRAGNRVLVEALRVLVAD